MSIRQYPLVWGTVEEATRRARESFLPIISALPGFVAYHIMDPGDTTVVTVSIFETKDGADESSRRAAGWTEEMMSDLVMGPPRIIAGPVVLEGRAAVVADGS